MVEHNLQLWKPVDIEVFCDKCDTKLAIDLDECILKISPCPTCMEENYERGYIDGKDCKERGGEEENDEYGESDEGDSRFYEA